MNILWSVKRRFNLGIWAIGLMVILVAKIQAAPLATAVSIGIGTSLPPYVITEDQSGAELVLIREALAVGEQTLTPKFIQGKGLWLNLQAGRVDGVLMNRNFDSKRQLGVELYPSEPLLHYQNGALTLQSEDLRIQSIEDLAGLKIVGFANASKVLGPVFAELVEKDSTYREVSDQEAQVMALYKGITDVVVGDRRIFAYFQARIRDKQHLEQAIHFSPIFPPSPKVIFFKRVEQRDRFNRGLIQLKASGRYQQIIAAMDESADH